MEVKPFNGASDEYKQLYQTKTISATNSLFGANSLAKSEGRDISSTSKAGSKHDRLALRRSTSMDGGAKMNHPQAIYESIPKEVRRKFEIDVIIAVNRLITEIENKLPLLTTEQTAFFRALGNAGKDGEFGAIYKAFGKVLTDE